MSLAVYIDYGTGWIELTNYDGAGRTLVRKEELSKTEILHKNGKSVINTCSFRTDMPAGLANDLINLEQDAQIKLDIDKDGINWFSGYARPVTSFNISIEDGYVNRQIEWEGVDSAWALKKVLSSGLSYSNKKICDPADTENSLVHLLLTDAGISSSDIDITVILASTIPLLSLEADDKEYFEILSELLYYYGCALNVAADGSFYVYKWADDSVPDKTTLDAWPSSESSFSANRNDIDSNRVQVKWSKVNTYSNRTIININVNQNIQPLSGSKYPPDGSTEHPIERELDNGDKITGVSNLRLYTYVDTVHAYDPGGYTPNKSVKKWIQSNSALNFAVRNKYNWSRWGDNWATISFTENLSDWKVSIQIDVNSNVNYQQLEYPYVYPDDVVYTDSMGITYFKIGSYKVLADIETLGERWTTEVGSGQKLEKIEAEWIYSEANAEALAQAILDLKEVSSKTFDVRIDEDVPVGTYRRLQNPHLNIDTVVRVVRKVDNIESEVKGYKVYRYTVEAVRPLSVLFSNVSGSSHTGQTAAEIDLGSSSAVAGLTPDGKVIKAIESSILEEGFTPEKDGLYFSDTMLGFFKDGEWKSFLKNDATFKFLGDSENFIEWDGLALLIQGTLQSANFSTGSDGWKIGVDGTAEFNGVTVRGVVEALSGDIGGWLIDATALRSAVDGAARIELNPTDNRVEVWGNSGTLPRVAMGYLGGLSDPANRANTLASTVFGFWSAEGDSIEMHGDMVIKDGQYKLEDDAGIEVFDTITGYSVLRFGSASGIKGMHFYDDTGALTASIYWDDTIDSLHLTSNLYVPKAIRFMNSDGIEFYKDNGDPAATLNWDQANGYVGLDNDLAITGGLSAGDGLLVAEGAQGPEGPTGPQGEKGDEPAHEWSDTQLRFQNPDGSWGDYTDLEGEAGFAIIWSAGTYPANTIVSYNGFVWRAKVETTGEPGVSSDWEKFIFAEDTDELPLGTISFWDKSLEAKTKTVRISGTRTDDSTYAVLVDSTATFITNGVITGDIIWTDTDLPATIISVDSETQVTLDYDPTGLFSYTVYQQPDIQPGWIELDGQTISDPDSPFDGMSIQDVIGEERFIRARKTAGRLQSDAIRNITGETSSNIYTRGTLSASGALSASSVVDRDGSTSGGDFYKNGLSFDASRVVPTAEENRPVNISAIPILKIKLSTQTKLATYYEINGGDYKDLQKLGTLERSDRLPIWDESSQTYQHITPHDIENLLDSNVDVYKTGWISRSDWTAVTWDVTHNLGYALEDLEIRMLIRGNGKIFEASQGQGSNSDNLGWVPTEIDNNTIEIRTGTSGIGRIETDNNSSNDNPLDTEAYEYNVIIRPIEGLRGPKGDPPDHQWDGTKLQFENVDGTWGNQVELKGDPGEAGIAPAWDSGTTYSQDAVVIHNGVLYISLVDSNTEEPGTGSNWEVYDTYQHILDKVWPIGSPYFQLPNMDDPATLGLPGTWDNISSNFAGDFFRVEGGDALAFGGGQQGDAVIEHTHSPRGDTNKILQGYSDNYRPTTGSYIANSNHRITSFIISSEFSGEALAAYKDGSGWVPQADENRPVNQTIRIWKRIS